jgi:Ca2+-transporting ATPase
LAQLGRVLGAVVVALSAVVMVIGLLNGRPLGQMAITGVSLVVAAVPESLPAVVTLALALGAYRMARGNAIARRLHAVETLGSVTVVASDKTGTLTEGRMAVERAITVDGRRFDIQGHGYEPVGRVVPADRGALADLARAAVLCNDAHLAPPADDRPEWTAMGDPVEAALLAFAARTGLDPDATTEAFPRIGEQPFDASARRMTTWHAAPDGRVLVVCKGAPEVVLGAGPLAAAGHDLAAAGLRVLAIAAASVDGPIDGDRLPPLHPLGVVGIGDPLRVGAADVADAFRTAGIRLLLITGDHPATAQAIAARLGIQPDDVYARIHPEQKLDIIAALQREGQVVAMTGDGVNDAPALRRADIGVAMGGAGTEVARQAADLVLTDDNLGTVALAVGEGRRIYDNIRRFLRYALSGGIAELLVMLAGPFVGLAVPLLPAQILWVNLLTHGLPGVALGAEPATPNVMTRPPRSPQQSVLGAGLGGSVLIGGTVIGACVLGAALAARAVGAPWQSVAFVVLGLAQLGVAFAVRAPRRRGGPGNRGLTIAVLTSGVLQIAGVVWQPLRFLLHTDPLSVSELLACAAVAAIPGGALAVTRVVVRRASRKETSGPAGSAGSGHTLESTSDVPV